MKIWDKGKQIDRQVEEFTVGQDRHWDLFLAPFDVLGSIAHAQMLGVQNIIPQADSVALGSELRAIYREIDAGEFVIEKAVEDVHSQIEKMLIERLGDAGERLHTGRSRNDQVLLDIRLFVRDQIREMAYSVQKLVEVLISCSEKHKNSLLPGYTHFQVAMPSSFGLWFAAYAESLVDDLLVLQAAYRVVNRSPLGSAAGYGTSFPLDRQLVADLLGMEGLNVNSVYAQMGRGKVERVVSDCISHIAATCGKLAADVVLYMCQNFSFVTLPENLITGSSIMPHKKNPDVFEIVRARCNRLQSLPLESRMVSANLPSGYHRDMQILKEHFFPAMVEIGDCLKILSDFVVHLQIDPSILADEKYAYLFSVDAVNELVQQGIPFRSAYRKIAAQIDDGSFIAPQNSSHTHVGSIGSLNNEQITARCQEVIDSFDFLKAETAIKSLLTGK